MSSAPDLCSCSHSCSALSRALAQRPVHVRLLRLLLRLLLRNDFACVEFDEHGAISFYLLDRHRQAEVVQQEELKLEMIELWER